MSTRLTNWPRRGAVKPVRCPVDQYSDVRRGTRRWHLGGLKALMADSADNLGDSLVYAMSLFVVARSVRWRAGAAFMKG